MEICYADKEMSIAMRAAFRKLAVGNFKEGLDELNKNPLWHDNDIDLNGPFRLAFPGAKGWGEELLAASLLKRHATNCHNQVSVIAHERVCDILRGDSVFSASIRQNDHEGRSPLAILRHALTGNLLKRTFVPLIHRARHSSPTNQRPLVGIVWASIENNKCIPEKSIKVDNFLSILDGVKGDFISLQRDLKIADPHRIISKKGIRIVQDNVTEPKSKQHLESLVEEICRLNCMVTISTTTAHIAASMGTKVILIVAERKGYQWFWQVQANHQKYFYPTVQVLLGKGKTGNWWESCLEQANKALLSNC